MKYPVWDSRLWPHGSRGVGFGDGVAGEGGSSSARPCRSWNVGDGIGRAAVIVAAQTVRSIAQTQRPIQMLMHRHRAAGQGSCASARVRSASEDSQSSRCCRDSRTLPLQTEDVVQIGFPARHKGTSRLLWLYLKTAIELSDVMLAQKAIGRLQGGAPRQPQLLWQAALPGGEVAARCVPVPAASRRESSGSRAHATPVPPGSQGPRPRRPWGLARNGCRDRCSSAEDTFPGDHFQQPGQHRGAGFFVHQLGIVDLAGGIVQNDQQVIPALVLKPAVLTAIDVQ